MFTVALLEAGGRPLLSPPNVPHLVITVDTCVMVEQRRVSRLFLDEVLYFQKRMARWLDPPIMYEFVTVSLPDHAFLDSDVTPFLIRALSGAGLDENEAHIRSTLATRALQSFEALTQITPSYFASGAQASAAAQALVSKAVHYSQMGPTQDTRSQRQSQILLGMERGKTGLWWQQEKVQVRRTIGWM